MCFYAFPDFHLSDVRVKVHFFERPRPRRLRAKFEQIATHAARQTEGKNISKTRFGKTGVARVDGEIQKTCANASNSIRAFWSA